jgi:hypothetical protein
MLSTIQDWLSIGNRRTIKVSGVRQAASASMPYSFPLGWQRYLTVRFGSFPIVAPVE